MSDAITYSIIRMFFDHDNETIATGLTLAEAKEHCGDSETSSSTCTGEEGLALTAARGAWFDGFEAE